MRRPCLATDGIAADASLVEAGPPAIIGAGDGGGETVLGRYRSVASAPMPLAARGASSLETGGGTSPRMRVVLGLRGDAVARASRSTAMVWSSSSRSVSLARGTLPRVSLVAARSTTMVWSSSSRPVASAGFGSVEPKPLLTCARCRRRERTPRRRSPAVQWRHRLQGRR